MSEVKTAGIGPSEALLLAHDVLKQIRTTELLRPSEDNICAVATLKTCYNSMVLNIPGAEKEVIDNEQKIASATPTTAFKQQIKQGQTIFAAPETASPAADDSTSDFTKDYRVK